jgi:hypothetical protein
LYYVLCPTNVSLYNNTTENIIRLSTRYPSYNANNRCAFQPLISS